MPKKTPKQATDKEYLALGKQLAYLFDIAGPPRKTRLLFNSFLRGIAQGFGVAIGGTVIFASLVWVLGLLDESRLLGPLVRSILDIVQAQQ